MDRREFLAGCAAAPVLPSGLVAAQCPTDSEVLRRVVERTHVLRWNHLEWQRTHSIEDARGDPDAALAANIRHGLKGAALNAGGHIESDHLIDSLRRLDSVGAVTCVRLDVRPTPIWVEPLGYSLVHEAMGVSCLVPPEAVEVTFVEASDGLIAVMYSDEYVLETQRDLSSMIQFAPDGGHRWARGERFLDRLP